MLRRIVLSVRALLRLEKPAGAALTRVEAAEQRLKPVTRAMESRFLVCGQALEGLTSGSQSLGTNSAELVRLATGEQEAAGAIDATMAVLADPIAYLDRHAGQLRERGAALTEAHAILGSVLNYESDLQAAVAPLRATRTMFRVEASRLAEADQAAFVDLADQIETLHEQVRGVFADEFAKLSETRATLTAVCDRVTAESARQAGLMEREKALIEEAIASLQRQIESDHARQARLSQESASVSSAVSRVVVALQSQDIIAQITQHLFEGIERLRTVGRSEPAQLPALVEMQRGRVSAALEQMQDSSAATGAAASDVLSAVGQAAEEALHDAEPSLETEFRALANSAMEAIQVLLGIADKIRGMSRAAVELGEDTLTRIEPLNQVTTALSDSVDHLSHQMNLVALNAQIQAVRIDAGTGLEVLAAHTAAVATDAARLGESIREGLESFRRILQSEVSALGEASALGKAQMAHLSGAVQEREQRLESLRQSIGARLAELAADFSAVREGARQVAGTARPGQNEEEGFVEMREALAELAGHLSALPGASREQVLRHMEDDDHHAIAAERENHLKIAGALGGALNGPPDESSTGDSQVELF